MLTFFIVAEPTYPIREVQIEDSVSITPENAYIIRKKDGFHIYIDGKYWDTAKEIPEELYELPMYEED